jgi:gamma-glutamylputrescine oxidase
VAIVGAGVTGCACAFTLAERGKRVRVYEAREVAGGASGRNGGFALRGAAPAYDIARRDLGTERARALWELTERTLDRLEKLAGDAFRRTGSLRLAADRAERAELEAEYQALRADGFAAEWRSELPQRLTGRFEGAIFNPPDGSLQPARWVRRLAAKAAGAGAELCEHTRVGSVDELDAEQVVIATDGYTRGLFPELDAVVEPIRGQMLATEPLERRLFPCPHYARRGYDYWQQTPDGRLVAGGLRDKALDHEHTDEEATTRLIQSHLEQFVADLLGETPAITHRWAGLFGNTSDRLPLVGPVPGNDGVWVAEATRGTAT